MLLLRTIKMLYKPANVKLSTQLYSLSVKPNMNSILTNICQMLSCSEQTAMNVYKTLPTISSETGLGQIQENMNFLMDNGISKDLISDNLFVLALENGALQRKLEIIKKMRPKHIDDFIPLLDMKEPILKEVATLTAAEYKIVPENSRIYYLSKQLQIPPATVSKYCSKCKIIFFLPFRYVEKKLNILLDYDVAGEQILQSLYIFACADRKFISRIEDILSNGLYEIKPWYFKCTDETFKRVLATKVKYAKPKPNKFEQKFKKRNSEKSLILNELNVQLQCDDKISAQIYYNFINTIEELDLAKENIKLLVDYGVSLEFIRCNSVVLTLPNDQIRHNIKFVEEMRPNLIEDFAPLVQVDTALLKEFADVNKGGIEMHPIYYFSEKLNISPTIVSKHFAEYATILFGNSLSLRKKLDLLVSYNVRSDTILKSPLTFRLTLEFLENQLKSLRSKGIENISSWMLVCDKSRMETVAALRVAEKQTFGDSDNTVDYLVKRLNWDHTTKEKALKCYPPLDKCSVIKVKAILDFLLDETHFTTKDISSNVAVFRRNLNELKMRINELSEIGLVPKKLYSICLGSKDYLKMVDKFCMKTNSQDVIEKRLNMHKLAAVDNKVLKISTATEDTFSEAYFIFYVVGAQFLERFGPI